MDAQEKAAALGTQVNGHPDQVPVVLPQLLALIAEPQDVPTLIDVMRSLGWTNTVEAGSAIARFVDHPDSAVRLVVAQALPVYGDEDDDTARRLTLAESLLPLTRDSVDEVRDWACHGLSNFMADIDSPLIREALADRLDDDHEDTRCEALLGLARRGDARAVPALVSALSGDRALALEIQAAAIVGDPILHDLLDGFQDGWETEELNLTADAAWRLTDPDGTGHDLVVGLADSLREAAAGDRRLGHTNPWWRLLSRIEELSASRAGEIAAAVRTAIADEPDVVAVMETTWLRDM